MLAERLIRLIAPANCLGCGREGDYLCADCTRTVVRKRPTCHRCNRLELGGRTCASCRHHTKLSGVIVAAHYEGAVKDLITTLKYQNAAAAAERLAGLVAPLVPAAKFDVVTWIPGVPSRYRRRGYHQAELIARQVARRIGLPATPLLGRLQTGSQVGLSRAERLRQVKGTFVARGSRSIVGQRVLVVDDVLTTGATLSEAASVLKSAGAKSIWSAVAAKH